MEYRIHTRVVSLTEATEQTSSRSSVNDTTELLFAEMRPGSSSTLISTIGVDLGNQIPVLVLHILKADITEDTGIVNENIYTAEVLNSGVDNAFTVLNTIIVGNSLPTSGFNLIDHNIGGLNRQYTVA